MAKIKMSEALALLPENTAEVLHYIFKQNLSDDFLVDLENKKIHINFPEPKVLLDIHAIGATLEPDTFVLTVNRENGEPFDVDLAKLAESKIDNPEAYSVTLEGNGTKELPLKADVKVSQEKGNQLTKKEDGSLFVPAYQAPEQKCLAIRDIFGQALGADGADIKLMVCGTAESDSASNSSVLDGVTYVYNNGFTSTFLDVKNFPAESINATITQVGGLAGNAVANAEHSVIPQDDGKYTHRFTFNSASFDGESTAPLVATIDGITVNKTLNHTGSTNDGGYIYEG